MLIARSQCFSACLIQGHRGFGSKQPDTSEGSSGPVEDPWWETWGWHITWKVLLTTKENKQKKGIFENGN